ncbi:hypothetical protein J6590_064748 [Homalodisca vitripennis]|nr:hypothetical protein J6590_064748 [Homalodisca vitripennis]
MRIVTRMSELGRMSENGSKRLSPQGTKNHDTYQTDWYPGERLLFVTRHRIMMVEVFKSGFQTFVHNEACETYYGA